MSRSQKKRRGRNKKRALPPTGEIADSKKSKKSATTTTSALNDSEGASVATSVFTLPTQVKKISKKQRPHSKSGRKKITGCSSDTSGVSVSTHLSHCSSDGAVVNTIASVSPKVTISHPFETDYGDHFETSPEAYKHIDVVLAQLCQVLGKSKGELLIYDPYYCEGSVIHHLGALGYSSVINRNRDFYADVENGLIPHFDVVVTNPPYSGDHKERCVRFCVESARPWLLLMPNYVALKAYFKSSLATSVESTGGAGAGPTTTVFYVSPHQKYEYEHPEGTGHETSPFHSLWFVGVPASFTSSHRAAMNAEKGRSKRQAIKPSVVESVGSCLARAAASSSRVAGAGYSVLLSVAELEKNRLIPTQTRPNSRRRKKMKKQRNGAY